MADIIAIGESMPIDKTRKRDRINYLYNFNTAYKIRKLMETGFFDNKTELLDECIDALYHILILKKTPPSLEPEVLTEEEERDRVKKAGEEK
jgi:hypothetical protein